MPNAAKWCQVRTRDRCVNDFFVVLDEAWDWGLGNRYWALGNRHWRIKGLGDWAFRHWGIEVWLWVVVHFVRLEINV